MSIRVMSQVWDNGPDGQGEMIVMLALADWSNDEGECWPSMAELALKARLSDERSARRIVRRLEEAGWLEIGVGGGRHGCNKYRLKLGPKDPRTESPPDFGCKKPGLSMPKTRTVEPAEPSRTVKEPSEVVSHETVHSVLRDLASSEAISSFIAYRRKVKGKALTVTAAKRLATNLRAIQEAGGNPSDALGLAEERGWMSVEPEWYARAKQSNPKPSAPTDERMLRWQKLAGGVQ